MEGLIVSVLMAFSMWYLIRLRNKRAWRIPDTLFIILLSMLILGLWTMFLEFFG